MCVHGYADRLHAELGYFKKSLSIVIGYRDSAMTVFFIKYHVHGSEPRRKDRNLSGLNISIAGDAVRRFGAEVERPTWLDGLHGYETQVNCDAKTKYFFTVIDERDAVVVVCVPHRLGQDGSYVSFHERYFVDFPELRSNDLPLCEPLKFLIPVYYTDAIVRTPLYKRGGRDHALWRNTFYFPDDASQSRRLWVALVNGEVVALICVIKEFYSVRRGKAHSCTSHVPNVNTCFTLQPYTCRKRLRKVCTKTETT